jgi:hypothetical protein
VNIDRTGKDTATVTLGTDDSLHFMKEVVDIIKYTCMGRIRPPKISIEDKRLSLNEFRTFLDQSTEKEKVQWKYPIVILLEKNLKTHMKILEHIENAAMMRMGFDSLRKKH